MEEILKESQKEIGKTYYDLKFLLRCFKEVLIENDQSDLAKSIPWNILFRLIIIILWIVISNCIPLPFNY